MLRHLFAHLAAAMATLACLSSCSKDTEKVTAEGTTVTLSFYTGGMETRATTPGDGDVADGGGIYKDGEGNPDLIILIADATTEPSSSGTPARENYCPPRPRKPKSPSVLPEMPPETTSRMPSAMPRACGR